MADRNLVPPIKYKVLLEDKFRILTICSKLEKCVDFRDLGICGEGYNVLDVQSYFFLNSDDKNG